MRPFCTWSLFLELSVRSEFVNTSLKALVIFSSVTREELFLIAKNSDITNMAFTPWLKINFQPWDRIALTNTHLMFSLSAIFDTPTGDFSYIVCSSTHPYAIFIKYVSLIKSLKYKIIHTTNMVVYSWVATCVVYSLKDSHAEDTFLTLDATVLISAWKSISAHSLSANSIKSIFWFCSIKDVINESQ